MGSATALENSCKLTKDLHLTVVERSIADLKPSPSNPRRHSHKQIDQIAQSIRSFGFNVPILVDAELNVIAGHGRLLAGQKLGLTGVPTIQLEHLNQAQVRAFIIADNKLASNSSWDDDLLARELEELSTVDLSFDLETIGFDTAEIDLRIGSINEIEAENSDDVPVPAMSTKPPVSKAGDVWILGGHKLICGDALDAGTYALLMGNERAAMVFADPPYNVRIHRNVSGKGRSRHREFAMASGEMSRDQFSEFLSRSLGLVAAHSTNGSFHYVCMDWRHLGELLAVGTNIYSELKNLCVWVKDNAGLGSLYRSQHELILLFKYGTGAHRNNIELGKHGRNRSNVWQYPSPRSLGATGDRKLSEAHPTVKPTKLAVDAIRDCTKRNDLVLDPFAGSGTVLLASEQCGRRYRGIEIDPSYVDLAIARWQRKTGKDAVHATTGMTFRSTEAQFAREGGCS